MANDALEDRMIEIERRLAFAERTNEELSAVVAEQGRALDALQRKAAALAERLVDLTAAIPPQDDKPPPHY